MTINIKLLIFHNDQEHLLVLGEEEFIPSFEFNSLSYSKYDPVILAIKAIRDEFDGYKMECFRVVDYIKEDNLYILSIQTDINELIKINPYYTYANKFDLSDQYMRNLALSITFKQQQQQQHD